LVHWTVSVTLVQACFNSLRLQNQYSKCQLSQRVPGLVVPDEIDLAALRKLTDIRDIVSVLSRIPMKTDVVITGRWVPKELIERADFVNEVTGVKHPRRFRR